MLEIGKCCLRIKINKKKSKMVMGKRVQKGKLWVFRHRSLGRVVEEEMFRKKQLKIELNKKNLYEFQLYFFIYVGYYL